MPEFFVNAPNYRPADYSWLGNLPNQFYQGAQEKQQYDLSHAFSNGVPMNPDGTVNAQALLQIYGKNGDVADIPQLAKLAQQSRPIPNDPLLSGLGKPAAGGGIPQAALPTGAPPVAQGGGTATAARTQSPTGDMPPTFGGGNATVTSLVSGMLPANDKSGSVASNIARFLHVDPTTPLDAGQQAKVASWLQSYVTRNGISAPRGIRNNNPGNIEDGSFARSQPGYAGTEAKGRFATFDTPQDGLNAATTLIGRYGKAGINTISGIVNKWAPPSDGNNTANYAASVAHSLGVDPNQPLDTGNPQVRSAIATAMAQFENGARGGPSPQGSSAASSPYQELWPQGARSAPEAIRMIDQDIDSYSKYAGNPQAQAHVKVLEDLRDHIASSITPSKFGPIGKDQYDQPIYGWINPQTQTVTPVAPLAHDSSPPGISNVHGDAYLQELDPNMANQVKALADGRLAFPSGYALKSPYWQKMLQYVSQYDPSFDAVEYNARSRARTDATSGKLAQNNNALNTGIGHIGQLADAVAGLDNVTWSQTVNRVKNAASAEFGGTGVTNFDAIKNRVAPEIVRIWRGAGGAESDIKRDIDSLSDAKTPAQLYGALDEIAGLMRSKIEANKAQYEKAMGPSGAQFQMITPQSQAILDKIDRLANGGAATAPAQSSGHTDQRLSPQQASKLPAGTQFVGLDGQTYVKH